MSATAVLIPIAVAIFATSGGLANQIREKRYVTQSGSIENIETKYVSADLLIKTLDEDVLCNVEMIEKEYQSNVQTYTYERVLNNLPENMSIDNETVLEDDSILITLTVD